MMTWNDTVEKEKVWLKTAVEAAPNETIRAYYQGLLGVLEHQFDAVNASMGYSHKIAGEGCSCGCAHADLESRGYLYDMLVDPVDTVSLGYSAYIPGLDGLQSEHLSEIKGLYGKIVVVSTQAVCADLLAGSTHPRKQSLKVLPFTFGHLMGLVLEHTILTDAQVVTDFTRFVGLSLRFHRMGATLARSPQPVKNSRFLLWGNLMHGLEHSFKHSHD